MATITINGVTYTYTYKTGTNLIESVGTSANTVSYGYESNTGRLQSISAIGASQTEYSAGYTYTDNDQRLTENVLQENPDTQAIDQRNWTFGYDGQDELTSVSDDGTTLYSYSYDGVGNRTDAGSVNAMNQYASFHYNGRGDVTDDGTYSYTWDAKDRLVAVEPDSPSAQSQKDVFTYDPENRKTQEDIFTWDAGNHDWVQSSTLKFVYNGSQMVAELDGQNHLLQSYAWGPSGTLLSITDYSGGTPTNYQVVTDGSGSVVELLDSSTGLVAASYQYDPWGNPLSATGPAANVSPFRWQGEFYDANFGGYYMGAREGSARLHVFLSPDPSGEASDPNLYRMVGNDPITMVDPSGLAPVNPSTLLCHTPLSSTQSSYYSLSAYMPSGIPNRLQGMPGTQPAWHSWFFTKMTATEIQNTGISAFQAQNMASQGPYVPKEEDQLRRMGFGGPLDWGHLQVVPFNVNGTNVLQISDGQHTVFRIGQSWGSAQNYGVQYFDSVAGVQNYFNLQDTLMISAQIALLPGDAAPLFTGGFSKAVGLSPAKTSTAAVAEKPSFLTVDEFSKLPSKGTINPWRIRTSQDTASWNFKPPFQASNIGEAADQLRQGQVSPSAFGPVKLVEKDGMIWSVDNRRVLMFRSAGMDIQYEKTTWDALTANEKTHFSSDTNGESIIILIPKGK